MKYWVGRGLEIFGMALALLGLLTGLAWHGHPNAIRYEISCLVAGFGVFYAGNWLRNNAEKS